MPMTDVPMYYLSQGQFDQVFLWVLGYYVGYGIIWLLIGLAIYGTVYEKGKSIAITTFIFALFLALVGATLPPEAMIYYTAIVGIGFFMIVYRVLR